MNKRQYSVGGHVRINNPSLREHGIFGIITGYDDSTQFYFVELDKGPPWRGKYEAVDLMHAVDTRDA